MSVCVRARMCSWKEKQHDDEMSNGPQELYLPIYPTVRNTYDTDKQHKAGKDKEELLENNYRQMMKRDREDPEKGDDYVSKAQP